MKRITTILTQAPVFLVIVLLVTLMVLYGCGGSEVGVEGGNVATVNYTVVDNSKWKVEKVTDGFYKYTDKADGFICVISNYADDVECNFP